jgi:hypothetical protein
VADFPSDWDGESYCVECLEPACHQRPEAMADDHPVMEMVCCRHARPTPDSGTPGDDDPVKALLVAIPAGIVFWAVVIHLLLRRNTP